MRVVNLRMWVVNPILWGGKSWVPVAVVLDVRIGAVRLDRRHCHWRHCHWVNSDDCRGAYGCIHVFKWNLLYPVSPSRRNVLKIYLVYFRTEFNGSSFGFLMKGPYGTNLWR